MRRYIRPSTLSLILKIVTDLVLAAALAYAVFFFEPMALLPLLRIGCVLLLLLAFGDAAYQVYLLRGGIKGLPYIEDPDS